MNRIIVSLFFALIVSAFTERGELSAETRNSRRAHITAVVNPDFAIKEGYVSQKKETVKIIRNGKVVAKVKLGKPVLVAQAEQQEKWGYFQFPGIGRTEDGKLIVSWQMNEDSHKAYGKGVSGHMMSTNEGRTWKPLDKEYFTTGSRMLRLRNGNIIQVVTPESKDVRGYPSFPQPVYCDASMKMNYYFESQLPDDLRGMYLCLRDSKGKKIKSFHGELEDPGLLRYDISGLMPLKWWGDIAELSDGSLIAGIYPSCYNNLDNEVPKSDITFYRSNDDGYHWKVIGRIPFRIKKLENKGRKYDNYQGFSEAVFEILKDSTMFCVMRSGYNTPMYKSYSYDGGKNWSEPVAFTPNGVRPRMLQLDNGILVLASGRPGLQIRFSLDGYGKFWTEPIDMLPFLDEKGHYDIWGTSCGYSQLLKVDENSFYIVYSDFETKNTEGELRKAIVFRKVTIGLY